MKAGLDIGGTKIDAVAIDDNGAITASVQIPTGFGPDQVLRNAISALTQLHSETSAPIDSIGVGIPGAVDTSTGSVRHAVNIGFTDVEFGSLLRSHTLVPVHVANDVDAATLGAYRLLALEGPSAYLNIGTGLAAGFIVDGAVWGGARGVTGEIGHIPVDQNGILCPCGQRGCLETVASGSALARAWPTSDTHPVRALYTAAEAGNTAAAAVRMRFATGIASAIRILILTTDVETVVIGGGVSRIGTPLLDDITLVFNTWAAGSTFIASLGLPDRLRLVPQGLQVGAFGAALLPPTEPSTTTLRP